MERVAEVIRDGKAVLGIEFGSTRIKAVLVDGECKPIASGSHEWENRLEQGYWTYSLEDIDSFLRSRAVLRVQNLVHDLLAVRKIGSGKEVH